MMAVLSTTVCVQTSFGQNPLKTRRPYQTGSRIPPHQFIGEGGPKINFSMAALGSSAARQDSATPTAALECNGLASVYWTPELSPHCPLLERYGADINDVSVSALSVVKALDVVEHVAS